MAPTASGRRRKAAGPKRPTYLTNADLDRVAAILLALISEVAALRERVDTHERLAAKDARPSLANVENYKPDVAAEADREVWRDAYIRRLFRVVTEDVEALRNLDFED